MPRTRNEYTAVAGAEKRLRDLLAPAASGELELNDIVAALTAGATIEYKPRLKSIVVTLPIPEPAPEPKLGKFAPVPVTDEYDPYPGEESADEPVG